MIFVHAFFYFSNICLIGVICLFVCFETVGRELGGYRGRDNMGGIGGGENMIKIKYTQKICQIFFKRKKSVYD